ncbi:hypothetical protein Tco_1017201 [Tanacetum coccineum]|uniref:Uncharacterized protein n=1 Tax=Tanacetum coccineum TaxID=301880 RepID=A0ABQ5FQT3_9ASTR
MVPTLTHDSPSPRGHTPGSDEGSMTLTELTVLYTQLSTKVASLEQDLKQTKKKIKKQLEQERLGHEEAVRLQEQINEEERQRIARDAEIAKQLQEEFDRVRQEQEVIAEADQAYDIDWTDPAILRYHAVQNRSFSKAEDSEIKKEVMKRPGFDFQEKSSKKRSREDFDEDNAKKQKLEDDAEKKELRDKDMMCYQIIRVDGNSKNYKIFSEMLDDFDRQDVLDLHRLVQESVKEEEYLLLQEHAFKDVKIAD